VAAPGEILVSAQAWQASATERDAAERRQIVVKGYDTPQVVYAC
jgi:hypothetical protein